MRPFEGRRILLGVTGGIASYKTVWLARNLALAGAEVDVVMTRSALEFVGAITFEGVTGRPSHADIFEPGRALDHIRLAREAHAVVVAPATADFMARAAAGQADDLLTACLLALGDVTQGGPPVLVVPAMNDRMWAHRQTQANAQHLRTLGYEVLEPDVGHLAAGEGEGPGRMPEPESIMAEIGRLLETHEKLAGRRVIVTAGPTREPVDPVRYLSNRSSGKMGVAIAAAAWRRGAEVSLIAGPISVAVPRGICVTHVESTQEMADAVARELEDADVLIMAAAPADFRPTDVPTKKIGKRGAKGPPTLGLEATPDILSSTKAHRRNGAVIVGFALETGDAVARGREKLREKHLDLIVVNDAEEAGAGFGVDTNRVTMIDRAGAEDALPLMSKTDVADAILDRVERFLA